jgi:hypothetical protein
MLISISVSWLVKLIIFKTSWHTRDSSLLLHLGFFFLCVCVCVGGGGAAVHLSACKFSWKSFGHILSRRFIESKATV